MANIIEIRNLYKSFKDVKAVQGLNISVKEGELFAFLGLNGAGKSTTISILCGEQQKDSGEVLVDGVSVDQDMNGIKTKLGVVFQNSCLDKFLSVKENLEVRASLYGIFGTEFTRKLEELDKLLKIKPLLNKTFGKMSGGEKRRIDIARALLNDPKILILDEPTTGLDPQTRKLVWNAVESLRKSRNMTIFLTTHYMEEANSADYIVILDGGKIAGQGTPNELKNMYTGDYIYFYNISEDAVKKLNTPYEKTAEGFKLEIENTHKATQLIVANPQLFQDYEIVKGNMDDVFLNVTGKKLREE